MRQIGKVIVISIFLGVVVLEDIKSYTIKNSWIIIGIIGSFLLCNVPMTSEKLIQWSIGVIVPILILFLLYIGRVLGAGDIKVFSVIGGMFGVHFVVQVIIYAFFLAAVLSIIKLIHQNNIKNRLQCLAKYIQEVIQEKKIVPYYVKERDGTNCVIHFTIAIFGAFIWCSFLYYKEWCVL